MWTFWGLLTRGNCTHQHPSKQPTGSTLTFWWHHSTWPQKEKGPLQRRREEISIQSNQVKTFFPPFLPLCHVLLFKTPTESLQNVLQMNNYYNHHRYYNRWRIWACVTATGLKFSWLCLLFQELQFAVFWRGSWGRGGDGDPSQSGNSCSLSRCVLCTVQWTYFWERNCCCIALKTVHGMWCLRHAW